MRRTLVSPPQFPRVFAGRLDCGPGKRANRDGNGDGAVGQRRHLGESICERRARGQIKKAGERILRPDLLKGLAASYSRGSYTTTSIGKTVFDVRVRNGNGSDHSFMATKIIEASEGSEPGAQTTDAAKF